MTLNEMSESDHVSLFLTMLRGPSYVGLQVRMTGLASRIGRPLLRFGGEPSGSLLSGKSTPYELCGTAKGGCSVTPTSKGIERGFKASFQ